ncbi:MAG: NUDIX hydrolase, partial [Pseudomonadota bacterium]
MIEDLIPAATIILLRDKPAFEALMVERHADIAFAGGALVFPGGRIDQGDMDPRWADHCDGFDRVPEAERAPRIAAIREA